ncbi:NAD(P)/FAD-dependent oxidoreductase [Larsenimonas salina]|uniref:NAD(P)/FAD-dependent oxidoreductase n=1 Tax=Larsenimonas salina TaxID=1295565 RepID=UPI0020740F2F|nr:NAD(P)/FAD-dependent oxidoreductase [Larsenimonas salina]MCM5705734.1 NAD(P)/FAD-dependent oxidoreductase [Larsenimonas salina]
MNDSTWDVVIIGAGAAGLMCALTAGYRGCSVLVLDHANKPGKKILMSGGGRCNFTNLNSAPTDFFSQNPHFCISALKRYTPAHFVELIERHGVEYVEKAAGQLFSATSSKAILDVLLTECDWAGVELRLKTSVESVNWCDENACYTLATPKERVVARSLVVATGGLSIPSMGASGFGYELARQFGLEVLPTTAALVPFTFSDLWKSRFSELAGITADVEVECGGVHYREPLLMTHRGLSGPVILKASTHWQAGTPITINWLPDTDAVETLKERRMSMPKRRVSTWLKEKLSQRLGGALAEWFDLECTFAELSNAHCERIGESLNAMRLTPSGTEGWRTAEVTLGGVNTDEVSSKTLEAKLQPGLYFIGEVLDVTGQLGGHNFQWAWASGVACGNALKK